MKTKIFVFIFLTIVGNMSYAQCWTKGHNDGWDLSKPPGYKAQGSIEANRSAIQIHTVQQPTFEWAAARINYDGTPGTYDVMLTSLLEDDGECSYKVLVNGIVVLSFTQPRIHNTAIKNYTPYTVGVKGVVIPKDAKIQVDFISDTNLLVPENNHFAFSRGRWRSLSIGTTCTNVTVDKWNTMETAVDVVQNK